MPEILTESFCERCGTRYTFESAAPRAARLKGLRVISRGFKNFVMSDDSSMDEAMAAARSDTDREVTSQQLHAFHKTFNFCMTCRQYTCASCWNDVEGLCLSCAPTLAHQILPAPFPGLDAHEGFATTNGVNGTSGHDPTHTGHDGLPALDAMAWPTSDLMREDDDTATNPELPEAFDATPDEFADDLGRDDVLARLAAFAPVEAPETLSVEIEAAAVVPAVAEVDSHGELQAMEAAAAAEAEASVAPVADLEPQAYFGPEVESVAADALDVEIVGPAQIDPTDVDGRATAAAAQTSQLLRNLRPGQSLDDELAVFESRLEIEVTEPETVPVVAAEPEPEAAIGIASETVEPVVVAPIEPEPAVAAEPEPEPVVAVAVEPEPVVAVAVEPEPVVAVAVEPEPVVAVAVEPDPVAADEPRVDVVAQPTWQIVAPDAPTADGVTPPASPEPPSQPAEPVRATAAPELPAQPQWPSERPAAGGLPFFNRPAAPTGGMEALWAESAREVTTAALTGAVARPVGGVRPCVSCGLSLSATARFCRRCGTPQA